MIMNKIKCKILLALFTIIIASVFIRGLGESDSGRKSVWNIKFSTESIEYILLNPEKILADPDRFWKTDKAYILADNWHKNTKIAKTTRGYYKGWLSFLKELAEVPRAERRDHQAFKFLKKIKNHISIYYKKSLNHIKSFLPKNNISFNSTTHITTKTLPYAFMTSGDMVIDVLSPKFKMDADKIFNILTHETFHIGYGYNRYLRREMPLKDSFVYNTLLDSLQNEGIAVYLGKTAQKFFPSPEDKDYLLLQKTSEIKKRLGWINEIFAAAEGKTISQDDLREKAWEHGVTQRGYYVLGAYMAQAIDQKLGREALLLTISNGPLSFIETYNKIALKQMRVYQFKKPLEQSLIQDLKIAVFDKNNAGFNRIANQLKKSKNSLKGEEQSLLIRLGYGQIYQTNLDWATRVFELNVTLFPTSANAYDCLGEAYMKSGDLKESERCYKKALTIDPKFKNAKKMLEKLKNQTAKAKKQEAG